MVSIAIFNQKGGVGKTSLCVNLSAALFRYHKKRVLVMDCDSQNNASEYLMRQGISTGYISDSGTIADCLRDGKPVEECIHNVQIKDGRKLIGSTIDVLPSGRDIDSISMNSIDIYRDMIRPVSDRYDYCLIDCPPQKMPTSLASICAADYILIPIWTENDSSFSGYNMAVELINQFRKSRVNETLKVLGLVVTKTKAKRSLDQYMLRQCRSQFGDLLFDTTIREAQAINDAYMLRNPVCYLRKSSDVANDYRLLCKEFMNRIDKDRKKAGV